MSLTDPLPALTPRERSIFWSLAIICAVSRFASRARSMWDWDEVLLCHGMRSYDVTAHHPHPPGFPVFIGLGRVVRLAAGDDFRSLQVISLVAGMLLFPAVYLLARELRLRFSTSVIAAALCVFLPNVWFFGGTAFSDVPAITLVVFAVALLFRGCRDPRAYLGGIFLLALAIGIRPQNALVGLFPLVIATRHRAAREIVAGALIGAVVIGTAYGGAIAATGSVDAYRSAIRAHSQYISEVDSYRSPSRPPLWRLAAQFFGKQYSAPAMNFVMTLLVIISIVLSIRARDRSMLYNALTFAPVAIAAWLFLDRYSVSRFSIGYCPMFAIFAADAVTRLARARPRIEAAVAAVLVGAFVFYTLPAFTVVRREVAPSVLAVQAAKTHFNPAKDQLFVAADMIPFVDYFMPGVAFTPVLDERAVLLSSTDKTPRLVAEVIGTMPEGMVFRRPRERLLNIARRHYFGAAYATVTKLPQFIEGWYPAHHDGSRALAARSVAILPSSVGETWLRLAITADSPVNVTVTLNGQQVESFHAQGEMQRDWHVTPAGGDASNRLEIMTERDRAVRVRFLSFAPYRITAP